jgi:hypothetical protein
VFTTPDDWLSRFKEAGGHGRFYGDTFQPDQDAENLPDVSAVLAELKGEANKQNLDQVVSYMKETIPVLSGWANF